MFVMRHGILFVMVFSFFVLAENVHLLSLLPWTGIVVGAVVAYLVGWLWYGVLFRKQYMGLIQNKAERTNWTAMVIQFLGTLLLAYLVGIFSLFESMFLLGLDALTGVILFLTLAGTLYQRGTTRECCSVLDYHWRVRSCCCLGSGFGYYLSRLGFLFVVFSLAVSYAHSTQVSTRVWCRLVFL